MARNTIEPLPAGVLGSTTIAFHEKRRKRPGGRFGTTRRIEGTDISVVAGSRGRYVAFVGHDRAADGCPVRIHYYPDFEEEDHLDTSRGWFDSGQ